MKKEIVILTGAGMSADSGLKTFRDSDGLWEGHDVMEVASIDGWYQNPELVLNFYNDRRKQAWTASPNRGHLALLSLEDHFEVSIITQNVDDLHEKAGSTSVLHLHGKLRNVRSTDYPDLVYDYKDNPIEIGDLCEKGSQLRPDIVWFGENVPAMTEASEVVSKADIFVIIGTSLVVYPAAGLVQLVPKYSPIYLVDPKTPEYSFFRPFKHFKHNAAVGTPLLVKYILENYT